MTQSPLFVAPTAENTDASVNTPDPSNDQDYADYQAWKRSRDLNAEPTTPVEASDESAYTPAPPAQPTRQGRGWQGGDLAKPAPKPVVEEEQTPQSYIWLADGSVERVEDADLPGRAGSNAEWGHWEKDGKVHTIVGVYPVEYEIKEGK